MSAPYTGQPVYPPPEQGYYPPPGQPYYPPPGQPGYPPPPGIVGVPPTSGGGYPPPGPQPNQWMPIPSSPPNCPPGLEYLTMVDQLLVHQKVELLEAFTGFETANKYEVRNNMGQKVYFAAEDTDCCTRNCCGPMRPFDMKVLDNGGREVIHLYRPLRCDSCCFPCCLQKLEVTGSGATLGYVTQEWSILVPKYKVENAAGECVLRIEGPFCTWSICGDVEFKVLSSDGSAEVGKITKQWTGLIKEAFTDADNFGITFPIDLDVNIKAVLLGACFLIDFMFFEKSNNRENDSPGMI
ncbi:phospholipid scramblase 1-like [Limulus polyphemus]|uniref:Phospholipid scramblase n=1 Tax=Limulus polyphemus TaxID=6850 RepID=A0ABM1TLA4_LIMPO|nr:phospholipid scramblase 1-like [Limulus polyphemus]XP_022256659.1 phospholipid scramblase 1-like [Limulus polyphemus]XP_022256660.1 phospholipid scramblase 1-like [Limulus polyphemus]